MAAPRARRCRNRPPVVLTVPQADADKLKALYYPADVRYIDADWITGAELQNLDHYQPYPYGVSPLALGYSYAKRAQLLMELTGQRPLQSSNGVVDSRPAPGAAGLGRGGMEAGDRGRAAGLRKGDPLRPAGDGSADRRTSR